MPVPFDQYQFRHMLCRCLDPVMLMFSKGSRLPLLTMVSMLNVERQCHRSSTFDGLRLGVLRWLEFSSRMSLSTNSSDAGPLSMPALLMPATRYPSPPSSSSGVTGPGDPSGSNRGLTGLSYATGDVALAAVTISRWYMSKCFCASLTTLWCARGDCGACGVPLPGASGVFCALLCADGKFAGWNRGS